MKPSTYLLLSFLLCSVTAYATHLKGAELTAKPTSTNTFTYLFTLTIYEEKNGVSEKEPWLDMGKGVPTFLSLALEESLNERVTKKVFTATHSFPAAGIYRVSFTGSNRNNSVNLTNGINTSLYIELHLLISQSLGVNSSPAFDKAPRFFANAGETFTDDYTAVDPEGDSLVYKLVTPFKVADYVYPFQVGGDTKNTFTIDAKNGRITWDKPVYIGNYVVTVQVEEWRQGIKLGAIYRDIQITVSGNGPVFVPHHTIKDPTNGSAAEESIFTLYPNPATQKVFVTMPETHTQAIVEVWNNKGQFLRKQIVQLLDNKAEVMEVSQFPAGLYVLKISSTNRYFVRKLIIIP
jgi:hypothetical protein